MLINTKTDPSTGALTGIDEILQSSGLKEKPANDFAGKLAKARLNTEILLQGVADIASNGDTDNARLQALKMGLQLNPETRAAINDDAGKQMPVFNIIIRDGGRAQLNTILMPRSEKVLDILPESETTV